MKRAVLLLPQSMYNVFFQAYDCGAFIIAVVANGVGLLLAAGAENLILQPLFGDMCGPCRPRCSAAEALPSEDEQKLPQPGAPEATLHSANGSAPSAPPMYAVYPNKI